MFRLLFYILSTTLLVGCGSKVSGPVSRNILERTWTEDQVSPAEREYCSTPKAYGNTVTISGTAKYEYRDISFSPGEEGLREVNPTPKAIRHAQFEITDTTDKVIQCGETNELGEFNFELPKGNQAYTLKVYSRSNNSHNKASVFKAPETNELYYVQQSFTANSNLQNITLLAAAKEDIKGGAFNILDQVHLAFDRLSTLLSPDIDYAAVSEIQKAEFYWEKGFNPGIYVGLDSSSGTSFLSRAQNKIFILGGINGDVNFADTDHFDNSIILHEYFHFLENTISQTDSPGGSHNGNQLLDPRLAWSEGTAQFFQAVILNSPTVLDTRGNIDGDTGFFLKLSVEEASSDFPLNEGEGEFREFAIARFLWDLFDSEEQEEAPESFDSVTNNFLSFWEAFANNAAVGFNSSQAYFRSVGLLTSAININAPTIIDADWNNLMDNEKISYPTSNANLSFRDSYGIGLVYTGGGGEDLFLVDKVATHIPSSNIENNHPVTNMNFHSLVLNSSQILSLTSTTEFGTGGSLKFYIFNENYSDFSQHIGEYNANESVSLAAGVYLVAVVFQTLPAQDPMSPNNVQIRYSFPGFAKGGF